MPTPPQSGPHILAELRPHWGTIAGGAVISLLAAAAILSLTSARNSATTAERLDTMAARVTAQVERQVRTYEYGLRGARGAIVAAGGSSVTREVFRQYSATRDVDAEFPGSRGFGFIRRVKPENVPQFLEQARRDGKADFQIKELSPNAQERFVIQYLEPVAANSPAIGLDIASESNRKSAALAAIDRDSVQLTAPITLVQAAGKPARGFLVFLPVFSADTPLVTREDRQAAAIGWTYTPIVIDEVLANLDRLGGEFGFAVTDVTDAKPFRFYATTPEARVGTDLSRHVYLSLYGRAWNVEVWTLQPFFQHLNLTRPSMVALATLATGLLLTTLLVLNLIRLRRRLQASVERSRLAAIVDGSNDAIVGKSLDGTVTDWNAAAERLFGYTAEEAIGRTAAELILPADRLQEERDILARVRNGLSVPHFRTVRRTHGGDTLDMLVNLSPIRSSDGALIGVATMARDIGPQMEAERQVRDLNASLERQVVERTAQLYASSVLQAAILNHAGYAVIATDSVGTITLFNPAAERLLGYGADELVGRETPGLFHDPEEVVARAAALTAEFHEPIEPGFEAFVARARRGLPESDTWTYVTKQGARIPVRLDITQLRSEDGRELGFLGIAMDLTEQNSREEELRAAKRNAEQAADAKAEFLAAMSHELRTPLNSIIGFSGMMLDGDDLQNPTARRHANLVHAASKTLLSIVNDVLDVSRIEAGSLDFDLQPFSPRTLVETTAELLRDGAEGKGVVVRVGVSDGMPHQMMGDDSRLRQILLNLVSNALKLRLGEKSASAPTWSKITSPR